LGTAPGKNSCPGQTLHELKEPHGHVWKCAQVLICSKDAFPKAFHSTSRRNLLLFEVYGALLGKGSGDGQGPFTWQKKEAASQVTVHYGISLFIGM
jgi:hypothetical protein